MGEPELIHAAIPPGSSILELGAGAGRVTMPLVALGHRVTAVDESAEMLSSIDGAATVVGDIRGLDLGRTFDVVLAASHLLNADTAFRSDLLATVRRHLAMGGVALFEVYDPDMDWAGAVGRSSVVGEVTITILRARRSGDSVEASVEYAVDGRRWEQPFVAEMLDDAALSDALAEGGLVFDGWLDRRRGWFAAKGAA
jgi:SAM-dependent methyltransferase